MKTIIAILTLLLGASSAMAKNLVADCTSGDGIQMTKLYVHAKSLEQLFTGSKSVNGVYQQDEIELPITFRKAHIPGASQVRINTNYLGNILGFSLNLAQTEGQTVLVQYSYAGVNYNFEMTCDLK